MREAVSGKWETAGGKVGCRRSSAGRETAISAPPCRPSVHYSFRAYSGPEAPGQPLASLPPNQMWFNCSVDAYCLKRRAAVFYAVTALWSPACPLSPTCISETPMSDPPLYESSHGRWLVSNSHNSLPILFLFLLHKTSSGSAACPSITRCCTMATWRSPPRVKCLTNCSPIRVSPLTSAEVWEPARGLPCGGRGLAWPFGSD